MGLKDHEIDTLLWNQFKNGEQDAFAEIFRKYYPGLFNYGCRISTDSNLVEDCIQELFMDMWRTSGKADIISLKAYIFKAFKFKLIKLLAKNNKTIPLTDENNEHSFELSREALLINNEQNAENAKKVTDAIEMLSPRQKEIIYLKFYLGLSYEEVSDIMQINYQAARNLIYQVIKMLKKAMVLGFSIALFKSLPWE